MSFVCQSVAISVQVQRSNSLDIVFQFYVMLYLQFFVRFSASLLGGYALVQDSELIGECSAGVDVDSSVNTGKISGASLLSIKASRQSFQTSHHPASLTSRLKHRSERNALSSRLLPASILPRHLLTTGKPLLSIRGVTTQGRNH